MAEVNPIEVKANDSNRVSVYTATSRLRTKVIERRRADQHGMLRTVSMFAAVAEAINTLITPDIEFRDMQVTGTFCNFCGAWLAGLSALLIFGASSKALSDAFRGGFVAAYTSFTHMVEHSSRLHCGRAADSSSHFYLVMSLLGGPIFYQLGCHTGEIAKRLMGRGIKERMDSMTEETVLKRARHVLITLILVSLALAAFRGGLQAALELCIGMLMAAFACYSGDIVALAVIELTNEVETETNSVNWGTIGCNFAALLIVNIIEYSGTLFGAILPAFGLIIVDKIRTSFCGALSAFGGYSEDVVDALSKGKIGVAAANLGMHALIVLLAIAFLSHAQCPLSMGLLLPILIGSLTLYGLDYLLSSLRKVSIDK